MSDEHSIEQRLRFIEFDNRSRQALRSVSSVVESELPGVLSAFYDKVRATPEVRRFFGDDRHMEGAQSAQQKHWTGISSGDFDGRYVDTDDDAFFYGFAGDRLVGTLKVTF